MELEYGQPAVGDAIRKLGYQFKDADTLPLKSILAVGIPEALGKMRRREREAFLKSDEPHFLLQVVTGAGPQDPDRTIVPDKPVAVSLRDLVHYAWLSAIPEDYSQKELTKVINAPERSPGQLVASFQPHEPSRAGKVAANLQPGRSHGAGRRGRQCGRHSGQYGATAFDPERMVAWRAGGGVAAGRAQPVAANGQRERHPQRHRPGMAQD